MTPTFQTSASYDGFWRNALITAALTALINGLIYLFTLTLGWYQADLVIAALGRPIPLSLIIIASLSTVLLGAGIKALLMRLTLWHKRSFFWIAMSVILLSFVPPLTIPGATLAMKLVLLAMHIIGGTFATLRLNRV